VKNVSLLYEEDYSDEEEELFEKIREKKAIAEI
jgi:hypothetical protein